jgi:hypothetical protein
MEGETASFWLEEAAIRERLIILAEWERMLQTPNCDFTKKRPVRGPA